MHESTERIMSSTSTNSVLLERRSLIRSFNEYKYNRVIAVCAPAGYGKTVAVTQWLDRDGRAKAIFTIDEFDNSLAVFCERFCVALLTCQPQNQTLNNIITHPSFLNAPDEFTFRAISALSKKKHAVLAIDDLHFIYNEELLKLLHSFIKRLPDTFQIVLISRHTLPSIFSDLWLKGQVVEIEAEQFLFSDAEVMALYKKKGSQITQAQAEDINRQAYGWAIGLNAVLLSDNVSFNIFFDYLKDFIQINIWENWDDTTRDFMLCTAALRELTPSVCEAMTGVTDSEKFLGELVQRGAFITQTQKGVFRYHHLFQQFLKHKVSERGESFTHFLLEKEGYWHTSNEDFYAAVDCFIRCKNHEGIDKAYGLLVLSDHNSFAAERLLPVFKHPEIKNAAKKYPRILYYMSLCAFLEGRVEDLVSFMDEFYSRWSEIASAHPGSAHDILYMRVLDFRVSINQLVSEVAELDISKENCLITLSQAGSSMHMPQLYRGFVDFSEVAIGDVVKNFMPVLLGVGWLYGEEATLMAETVMSGLMYEQGNLEKAHKHAINAIVEMKDHFLVESKFCAMSMLIMVRDAFDRGSLGRGSSDGNSLDRDNSDRSSSTETDKLFESISKMIEGNRAYYLNNSFNALVVRRKIAAGNTKAAKEWLEGQSTINEFNLSMLFSLFTTCRAHIFVGEYDLAIIPLKKILKIACVYNRPLDILEAHILLTIAYWKKKRTYQDEALEHLKSAVCTAYSYNYVQMFINDGVVLAGILHKLKKRLEYHKDVDENIINFIKVLYLKTRSVSKSTDALLLNDPAEKLVKFTNKQKAVMDLLCQGRKYKDVAEILGIKQSSVVSHIDLIYKKLDVTNLVDAVAKVNAMGLLE